MRMERMSMNQTANNIEREHRVGTITAGASLIIWGIAFILHEINFIPNMDAIMKLWPLILIGIGVEILWFNKKEKNIIYDKGAVVLMIIMTFFSMMMAIADMCMKYVTLQNL